MARKQFPKVLYVKWEEEDRGADWLNASADPANLAEREGTATLAMYELVGTVKAENKTVLKP